MQSAALIPVLSSLRVKFVGSPATLATAEERKQRQPADWIRPYVLVLGFATALAAGTPDAAIAG